MHKDDWVKLAVQHGVEFKGYWQKAKIKDEVLKKLVDLEVVDVSALDLCEAVPLRQVKAKSIIPVLTKFLNEYGIRKIVVRPGY